MIRTLLFKKKQNKFSYDKNMIVFSMMFAGFMTTMEYALIAYFNDDTYKHACLYNVNDDCHRGGGRRGKHLTST